MIGVAIGRGKVGAGNGNVGEKGFWMWSSGVDCTGIKVGVTVNKTATVEINLGPKFVNDVCREGGMYVPVSEYVDEGRKGGFKASVIKR